MCVWSCPVRSSPGYQVPGGPKSSQRAAQSVSQTSPVQALCGTNGTNCRSPGWVRSLACQCGPICAGGWEGDLLIWTRSGLVNPPLRERNWAKRANRRKKGSPYVKSVGGAAAARRHTHSTTQRDLGICLDIRSPGKTGTARVSGVQGV